MWKDVMRSMLGDSAIKRSQGRGTHNAWWTQGKYLGYVSLGSAELSSDAEEEEREGLQG